MSIKHKRAPSSLDGHLDSSKIENEYSPVCRKEKKRNLNIFHAAKYRNRKKQQLETLFQEENELQKKNIQAKVQIEKLESTILTLIWQQTKKTFNSQTVFSCPVCGNVQKEVARLRSHINMLHNDTEALMKFLMLQRSPTITSTITSASTSSTSVPFRVNSN
jgi:rubrerythrin